MQNSGVLSKYGAVEARPLGVESKSDCNFLGRKCNKKNRYKKRRKNG
jgi:hypothetical protein